MWRGCGPYSDVVPAASIAKHLPHGMCVTLLQQVWCLAMQEEDSWSEYYMTVSEFDSPPCPHPLLCSLVIPGQLACLLFR